MWLRRLLIILLIFSIHLNVSAQDKLDAEGLPSKEFTYQLMREQPDLIWQMVRKLYAIEQGAVSVKLPDLIIVEKTDNSLMIGYPDKSVGYIDLGLQNYKVSYEFKIENKVIVGYKENIKIPLSVYIGASCVLLFTGFVVGFSLH